MWWVVCGYEDRLDPSYALGHSHPTHPNTLTATSASVRTYARTYRTYVARTDAPSVKGEGTLSEKPSTQPRRRTQMRWVADVEGQSTHFL